MKQEHKRHEYQDLRMCLKNIHSDMEFDRFASINKIPRILRMFRYISQDRNSVDMDGKQHIAWFTCEPMNIEQYISMLSEEKSKFSQCYEIEPSNIYILSFTCYCA